jgi:MerR family redox-sensitive transcriptional activator SoxR
MPEGVTSETELLAIGEVAERTGVATSALRYYEELGLLEPRARVGGRRRYGPEAVAVVGVILFLRDVGFTLAEVAQLMESRAVSPAAWRDLAQRKLDELDRQLADAEVARTAIDHALHCPRDDLLECPNFWSVVGHRLSGGAIADAEHL